VSGSGPAYFFLAMEALEQAAVEQGLDAATARLLAVETAFGAAKMALESGTDPAELRRNVTSPGGTTERAIAKFQDGGFERLFKQAVAAATARSRELADMLGGE
ncbi:MAG: pyrroline-5-carboxylate reductase dimerization domain-containing protein, partial [Acidiferrobacterales bacterium]